MNDITKFTTESRQEQLQYSGVEFTKAISKPKKRRVSAIAEIKKLNAQ